MRTGDCKCQSSQDRYPSGVATSQQACLDSSGIDARGVNIGCEYCSHTHDRVPVGPDETQHKCVRKAGIDDLPRQPLADPVEPPTPFEFTKEVSGFATVWFASIINESM